MKIKDKYIEKLANHFGKEKAIIASLYEIVYKRDWNLFIADMADFLNHNEVRGCYELFAKQKAELSSELQDLLEDVEDFMKHDSDYKLHDMEKEM